MPPDKTTAATTKVSFNNGGHRLKSGICEGVRKMGGIEKSALHIDPVPEEYVSNTNYYRNYKAGFLRF
ncbi:MAG: hypothetical protein V7724_04605 [Sediminicola sp.]